VNNNSSNSYQGAVMKGMGVVAGVSDMIYLSPLGVVALEFKTETGRQSASQKEWQRQIEAAGYKYYIVRSLDDFLEAINKPNPTNHAKER
jgi:hypothetical protein